MKRLLFILFVAISISGYSQSVKGDYVGVGSLLYGYEGTTKDSILYHHPDSARQYILNNIADPTDSLMPVNLRYFNNNVTGGSSMFDYIEIANYMLLNEDTVRINPVTTADGQGLRRINGAWTNTEYTDTAYISSLHPRLDALDTLVSEATLTDSLNLIRSTFAQTVYSISLPYASTVAGRVAGAVEGTDYPSGWVLAAGSSPIDIDITHNLGRRVAYVSVFAVTGTQEQMLIGTAAYNGIITPNVNSLRIQSLATISKPIRIYIVFE